MGGASRGLHAPLVPDVSYPPRPLFGSGSTENLMMGAFLKMKVKLQ